MIRKTIHSVMRKTVHSNGHDDLIRASCDPVELRKLNEEL